MMNEPGAAGTWVVNGFSVGRFMRNWFGSVTNGVTCPTPSLPSDSDDSVGWIDSIGGPAESPIMAGNEAQEISA